MLDFSNIRPLHKVDIWKLQYNYITVQLQYPFIHSYRNRPFYLIGGTFKVLLTMVDNFYFLDDFTDFLQLPVKNTLFTLQLFITFGSFDFIISLVLRISLLRW